MFLSEKFEQMKGGERRHFLERARAAAEVTIPTLIRPEDNANETEEYPTPYQAVGARGVNSLSAKLLLSLLPPSQPFFRLLISDSDVAELEAQGNEGIKTDIDASLSKIERAVLEEIEDSDLRSVLFETLKQLVVTGNCLFYVDPDGTYKAYNLEKYVVKRDLEGNVMQVIIKEVISRELVETLTLSEEVVLPSQEKTDKSQKDIPIYTSIERIDEKSYQVRQEVLDKNVVFEDGELTFAREELPWICLRMSTVTGESYGRGYVESILGDLKTLEALTEAITEAAAMAAKVLFLVRPGSTTRPKVLTEAPNGAFVNGDANDITTLQVQKGGDLQQSYMMIERLENRLGLAFMLFENAVRDSERTTATEIRALIQSLEQVLAGVYSVLAQELLRPMVRLIIKRLSSENEIPELPEEIKLIISTGLSSLGRTSDLERITSFTQLVVNTVGPEAMATYVNPSEMIRRIATAVGIEKDGLVKTEEEIMQEQLAQQAAMEEQQGQEQMMQMMQKVAPEMLTNPELTKGISTENER